MKKHGIGAHGQQPRRLIDHEDIVVLVKDREPSRQTTVVGSGPLMHDDSFACRESTGAIGKVRRVPLNAIASWRRYRAEVLERQGVSAWLFLGRLVRRKVLVHEKAVPAMIGVCNTKPHHGGTANGQGKEARPPATAGQVVDRLDAGVSHTGGFQASAKCLEAKEIPALGSASVALHPLADDLLLRRQPAREVRGGQGVLRGLLSQTKTSRESPLRDSRRPSPSLPMPVLRALAAAIRGRVEAIFGDRWKVGNFIPFGCDGTRQACPRTEELEQRLGTFGKEGSSPMIWNTSIVHLTLGFPFCWRLGKGGKASERSHLISMLRWLPAAALIVADAGYVGYEVAATMISAKRVLSHPHVLQRDLLQRSATSRWTSSARGSSTTGRRRSRSEGKPPIRGRLMRIHSCRHKMDVWLFTNVEDPQAVVRWKRRALAIAGGGKTKDFSEPTSGR